MKLIYKFIPFVAALMVISCSANQQSSKDTTIHVESVSLDKSSLTLNKGETDRLIATITPDEATEKTLVWSSSNTDYVEVNQNGIVTAIEAGNATVTVKSKDGAKTARCEVTVTASPDGLGTFSINASDFVTSSYANNDGDHSSQCSHESPVGWKSKSVMQRENSMQWRKNEGYIYNTTAVEGLSEITIETSSAGSFSGTLYSGTAANPSSNATSITNGKTYTLPSDVSYFRIKCGSSTGFCQSIVISHSLTKVEATGISIDSSLDISANNSKALTVSYVPSNANYNKQVTWSKVSGDSDISVNSTGVVSASSTASVGDTAVIKAELTNVPTAAAATCTVRIVEQTKDAWTVMMYVCGSNLESDGGAATTDLSEVLKIGNQPSDINIVCETGGSTKWYGSNVNADSSFQKDKNQRWEVRDGKLYLKQTNSKAYMNNSSTLESFVKWAVGKYPAEKYALILWNHGGAMEGVCIDDRDPNNSSWPYDYLTNAEVKTAMTNVFNDATLNLTGKMEFIGYDACAMQVQDIAEFNSQFFNYMVASEELENGDGWDYTCWIDDLYNKKSTEAILTELCSGFVDQYGTRNNNQTLSWLDLSAMPAYKTAWESFAASFKNNVKNYENSGNKFYRYLINNVKHFGDDGGYNGYDELGIFDVKDFLNKIKSNSTLYSGLSSLVTSLETAFSNLVKCSKKGNSAGNANGLMLYFDTGEDCQPSEVYSASQTNFTNWRSIVTTYGYNA